MPYSKAESYKKWVAANREHVRAYKRQHYKRWRAERVKDPAYRATENARAKAWGRANPKKQAISHFRSGLRKYGIDFLTYSAMLIVQCGKCSCCSAQFEDGQQGVHVDHDHSDGRVRGLVCGKCNHVIGRAEESVPLLHSCIAYLERFQ